MKKLTFESEEAKAEAFEEARTHECELRYIADRVVDPMMTRTNESDGVMRRAQLFYKAVKKGIGERVLSYLSYEDVLTLMEGMALVRSDKPREQTGKASKIPSGRMAAPCGAFKKPLSAVDEETALGWTLVQSHPKKVVHTAAKMLTTAAAPYGEGKELSSEVGKEAVLTQSDKECESVICTAKMLTTAAAPYGEVKMAAPCGAVKTPSTLADPEDPEWTLVQSAKWDKKPINESATEEGTRNVKTVESQLRNVEKKLGQIKHLKNMKAGGKELEVNQLAKIKTEATLCGERKALYAKLKEHIVPASNRGGPK